MAAVAGAVMDHEIGHNFGLIHDDNFTSCSCSDPTGKCIMYSSPRQVSCTLFHSCNREFCSILISVNDIAKSK